MYLSQAYMRNKTNGQKQALYLLAYVDANRLGESDLVNTIFALRNHLDNIVSTYPELHGIARFDNLFEVEDHNLLVRVENLRELCERMKQLP